MDIKSLIAKYGKDKVRAIIPLRPLNVYFGFIALTSSNDPEVPIMCELDEKKYNVEDDYKIGWKPMAPFDPKRVSYTKMHDIPGFSSETYYISDFNKLVEEGFIKVFVDVSGETK